MKKYEYYAVILSMTFIVIMFCVFMFWWVYPYKTVEVNTKPYIVETKNIKRGDDLVYVIDYCKYTNVIPVVYKQFIDGIIYSVPESNINLPIGCHKVRVSVKVPDNLPSDGDYKLRVNITFQMNPIRTITSEYETEKFSVTK